MVVTNLSNNEYVLAVDDVIVDFEIDFHHEIFVRQEITPSFSNLKVDSLQFICFN